MAAGVHINVLTTVAVWHVIMLKYSDVSQAGVCKHGNEPSLSMKYCLAERYLAFKRDSFVEVRYKLRWKDTTLPYAATL